MRPPPALSCTTNFKGRAVSMADAVEALAAGGPRAVVRLAEEAR